MTDCSAVPAIIDAVYALLLPLEPGVTVIDGPFFGNPPSGDFVCVGWSPVGDLPTSQASYANTARDRNETFSIPIAVSTYGGDGTFKTLRDRAKVVGDLVAAALVTGPSLSVITGWAGVTGSQWHPETAENGPVIGLVLHVQGTARI